MKRALTCSGGTVVLLILMLTVFAGVVRNTFAVTYYVAPDGDDNAAGTDWATALRTITNGVAKATAAGDEVILSNGVYYVTNFVVVNRAITVRGMTTNRDLVVVNGNYPVTTNRCFYLTSGAVLADMTITNGYAQRDAVYVTSYSYGGGVYIYSGGTIRNCVVAGNVATNSGAGIYMANNAGNMVTNCVVAGNVSSNGSAGGIRCLGGSVRNCVVSNNFADLGWAGGVSLAGTIRDSDIVYNRSATQGGGIYMSFGSVVSNCLIANNSLLGGTTAWYGGGGVCQDAGILVDCRIINNNSGPRGGGGLFLWRNNGQTVKNCTIVSNVSGKYDDRAGGGGVFFYTTIAAGTFQNCLIAENTSSGNGGGIAINDGSCPAVVNCTIVGNTALNRAGGVGYRSGSGRFLNCIVSSNWGINGTLSNWHNTLMVFTNCCTMPTNNLPGSDNMESDPRFVDSVAGNFRLRTRSPCINAGLNQAWMDTAVDLDGKARRYDGTTVDIGAYEYEPPPSGTLFIGW